MGKWFDNLILDESKFLGYAAKMGVKGSIVGPDALVDDVLRYADEMRNGCGGAAMPWSKMHGEFALRSGEMTVWTGYKGHQKSSVLSEVTVCEMAQSRASMIISPEFPPHVLLWRMIRQSAGTTNPPESYVRAWVSWARGRVYLYARQGNVAPDYAIDLVEYAIHELKVHHVVFDSLMKIEGAPDDYALQKSFVARLQKAAHGSEHAHVHLVAHARKGMDDRKPPTLHDLKGTSEIADMPENVITVWANKAKQIERRDESMDDEPDVVVSVESQRNWPNLGRYMLWHGRGLRFVSGPNYPVNPYFEMPMKRAA